MGERERDGVTPNVDHRLKILEDMLSDGQNEFSRRYNNLKINVINCF